MATAAAQTTDAETSLLEERVDTGLTQLLENYRPVYTPGGAEANRHDNRFTLLVDKPIPELSHSYAQAFEARDDTNPARPLYAMVCANDLPYRSQAVTELEGFVNPHLVVPLGAGTVKCSHLSESRYVVFFERPHGTPLSDIIENQTRLHETRILDYVLDPACKALLAMREKKIHHGNIHPGAFFIGETSMLGECFTAPGGTLGHYIYEPLERLMCDPLGHGEADEKTDIYALGILAFELMYGLERLKAMSREEFIERAIRQGTHQMFAAGRDFSDSFQDFFRGILNDNAADRWGLDQLAQWIAGKRFNMIAPSVPKDASRPIVFNQEQLFSRRLLAHSMHRNWREAIKELRVLNLPRWCETSLHRPELAERIERAMRNGNSVNASERQVNDMMARIFCTLDPVGPMRTKNLSLRPDALPIMLAYQMQERGPELTHLINMIQTNLASFWIDQAETNKTADLSQFIHRLQRLRPYLEIRSLGFGVERILYELNPSLCCQSPLLKPFHVTTAADALHALDALAKTHSESTSLVDRHIAGFLAAKSDINKEVRLDDLTKIPELAASEELLMLRIIARAQAKQPRLKLVGLCAWAGIRIESLIDQIHNRVIRKRQKLQLKRLASTGYVQEVLSSIINRDVVLRDTDGFHQAVALYDLNTKRIDFLQSPLVLEYKARKLGGKIAVFIGYTILVITGYMVMMG